MQIAHALPSDSQAIAEIHVRAWQEAYEHIFPADYLGGLSVAKRKVQWDNTFAKGDSTILVARIENQMIGWISMGRSRDSDATVGTAEIYAFYVLASHWSKGVGRALWSTGRRLLERQSFGAVTLWVMKKNPRGIRFYEATGFHIEPDKVESFELGGILIEEVRYTQQLSG